MFCKNCGKEINEDVKYCNFCGVDIKNAIPINKNNFYKKAIDFLKPLGKEKKWLITVMILLLLNPMLSLLQSFKHSENITGKSIYSHTESVFDVLFQFAEELPFVSILIFIGILSILFAEFLMVLPLIKKNIYQSRYLMVTKIISIIAFLFIGFLNLVFFVAGGKNTDVKVSLTFWGWLLNFDTIALVVTTFKFSSIIKKKNKKDKELEKQ